MNAYKFIILMALISLVNTLCASQVGLIGAMNDYVVDSNVKVGDGAVTLAVNPVDNDGYIEKLSDGTGIINLMFVCNNEPASTIIWENKGLINVQNVRWRLEGEVTYSDVVSAHAGIRGAYLFDGSSGYMRIGGASIQAGSDSYSEILSSLAIDRDSATFEMWVRLHPADLTQFSTLFECGGGTGTGIAVENGVLTAASGLGRVNEGKVSYNLLTDPQSVLIDECTNEFFQVVYAIDLDGNISTLYINGQSVGSASNSSISDWDGGDGTSIGHFTGTNHGGFQNSVAGTKYDSWFHGAVSIYKLHAGALTPDQVKQNYNAIHNNTDAAGNPIILSGVYTNDTEIVRIADIDFTLPSGATVRRSSVDGSLTYNPDTIYSNLIYNIWAGHDYMESFRYEVVDGSPSTNSAVMILNVGARSEAVDDAFAVNTGETRTFQRGELIGNDQQLALSPWMELNAAAVSDDDVAIGRWRNLGSIGASRDYSLSSGFLVDAISGFGGIGRAWRNIEASGNGLDDNVGGDISRGDLTLEIWFKPDLEQRGDVIIYESGGYTIGMYVVYETENNAVRVSVDSNYTTDPANLLEARIEGVSWNEFNQLLVMYDRDNPGVTDSLTLYLNSDPSASFSTANSASHTNALGLVNDFSGGDPAGIGRYYGQCAHEFRPDSVYKGDIAIIAAYDHVLSAAEMSERYEQVKRGFLAVDPAAPAQTALGAVVTLDPSGTITYDASNLNTNLLEGQSALDSFSYTVSDGAGGVSTAAVAVTVLGLDSVRTQADNITINAGDSVNSFDPLANDIGFGAGAVLNLPVKLYNFRDDYMTGNEVGDVADFRDGNGYGVRYMWNAPEGWVDGDPSQFDAASGAMGSPDFYRTLIWDGSLWQVNATANYVDGFPGGWITLKENGPHAGLGVDECRDGVNTNYTARGAIVAYTVAQDGCYQITDAWINKSSDKADGVVLGVYTDATQHLILTNAPATRSVFNLSLGHQSAGSTIYICVDSYLSEPWDALDWDFTIYRSDVPDSGNLIWDDVDVMTDGATISFDTADKYRMLGVGQVAYERFSYSVNEGGVIRNGTITVEIHGVNDAPIGVDDDFAANEDEVFYGSLTANDIDIDFGDQATLTIGELNGGALPLNTPFTTPLGAIMTVSSDGSLTYNPNGQFEGMLPGEFVSESFTCLVRDQHGADAAAANTVTINVEGRDDGITAVDNVYTVKSNRVLSGNLITDDTGSGVDSSIDINDELSVFAVDAAGIKGVLDVAVPQLVAKRGKLTNLTHVKQTINYGNAGVFQNPVVFAQPVSRNETETAVVRITNVNAANSTFDIQIIEQPEDVGGTSDGDGDVHAAETVSWFVFEVGEYQLLDGTLLEVGTVLTDAVLQKKAAHASSWQSVAFSTEFNSRPVVINQLQSADYPDELFTTRMNGLSYDGGSVTVDGFQVAMQDFEYDAVNRNASGSKPETIGWLAIEQSVGLWHGYHFEAGVTEQTLNNINVEYPFSNSFTNPPSLIGCVATYYGQDPCTIRMPAIGNTSFTLYCEEDTTLDPELVHANTEAATYLAIEGDSGDLYAYPQDFRVGAFTFDPNGEFDPSANGPEDVTFTYTLVDLYGNQDTATVTITVVTPYDGTVIIAK